MPPSMHLFSSAPISERRRERERSIDAERLGWGRLREINATQMNLDNLLMNTFPMTCFHLVLPSLTLSPSLMRNKYIMRSQFQSIAWIWFDLVLNRLKTSPFLKWNLEKRASWYMYMYICTNILHSLTCLYFRIQPQWASVD